MIYLMDILNQFDYYFNSVVPVDNVVDYSRPHEHRVPGFDLFPIVFPSFSEPIVTTKQYTDFAQLQPGHVVIDLGAYSGLASIIFAEQVGKGGLVIAVEADEDNYKCAEKNVDRYYLNKGVPIDLIYGAAWSHSDGIGFSCEGNMGAGAGDIVGLRGGRMVQVPSYTLSDIARGLDRVNFVKIDVEGAEAEVIKDAEFFNRYNPRMIIETHNKGADEAVYTALVSYGYNVKYAEQNTTMPLLECVRE
jgi:FkbM family methyltransferase